MVYPLGGTTWPSKKIGFFGENHLNWPGASDTLMK